MKNIVVLFLFFGCCVHGQTSFEQSLYSNNIDLVVEQPGGYVDYFDAQGKLLGRKKVKTEGVFYYDKNLRLLKKIKSAAKQSVDTTTVKKNQAIDRTSLLLDDNSYVSGNLIVKRIKNDVFYYTLNGKLLRTSKKKWFSNRIVYRDHQGKRLGSKKRGRNGVIIYKDASNRVTGKSVVNANGVVVYEAYKNRITPQFMLTDPYYVK